MEAGEEPLAKGRARRPGGGRKTATELDPRLAPALLALVEPDDRGGDPMSPLRWTTKSLRNLAEELTRARPSRLGDPVANVLKDNGFSLQTQAEALEGGQHPDRDVQVRYINEQVKQQQQAAGHPLIGVERSSGRVQPPPPHPPPPHPPQRARPRSRPRGVRRDLIRQIALAAVNSSALRTNPGISGVCAGLVVATAAEATTAPA